MIGHPCSTSPTVLNPGSEVRVGTPQSTSDPQLPSGTRPLRGEHLSHRTRAQLSGTGWGLLSSRSEGPASPSSEQACGRAHTPGHLPWWDIYPEATSDQQVICTSGIKGMFTLTCLEKLKFTPGLDSKVVTYYETKEDSIQSERTVAPLCIQDISQRDHKDWPRW